MARSKIGKAPSTKTLKVREISEDEHRAKTRQDSEEWRKLLQVATKKILQITCDDYREARTMAQRMTAVRSFYGLEVTIQHRGKEIYLKPKAQDFNIEGLDVDSAPETPE